MKNRICQICQGSTLVEATEYTVGDGWTCKGINGLAKCNRPSVVRFKRDDGHVNIRIGMAPCPLCSERKIKKSSTENFGLPDPWSNPW